MRVIHALTLITLTVGNAAFSAEPITGKMAKFDVAGRIAVVVEDSEAGKPSCDVVRFNLTEAARLIGLAKLHSDKGFFDGVADPALGNNTPDRQNALSAAYSSAKAMNRDAAFCDRLFTDAGSWGLANFVGKVAPDAELKAVGHLSGYRAIVNSPNPELVCKGIERVTGIEGRTEDGADPIERYREALPWGYYDAEGSRIIDVFAAAENEKVSCEQLRDDARLMGWLLMFEIASDYQRQFDACLVEGNYDTCSTKYNASDEWHARTAKALVK